MGAPLRRLVRATGVLLCVSAVVVLVCSPALAYERTQTCEPTGKYRCKRGESPKPVAWPVRCVKYRINKRGSSDFDNDGRLSEEVRGYVRSAFEAWNRPSCSDLQLVEGAPTSNGSAEYNRSGGWTDNMNLVVWRDDRWPYEQGHSFALTSVTYDSQTGRIADADIEINTAESEFAHLDRSRVGETEKIDLVNALTHEVGHLVGLDHVDIRDATMFGSAAAGEIKKRSLHSDDIRGLCAAYPAQRPRATCDDREDFIPNDPTGATEPTACATTSSSRPPVGGMFVVLLAAGGFVVARFPR